MRWGVFLFLGLVGVLFYRAYSHSEEQDLLLTAQRFFNAPWTRFIPVWGWVKGIMICGLEGNIPCPWVCSS